MGSKCFLNLIRLFFKYCYALSRRSYHLFFNQCMLYIDNCSNIPLFSHHVNPGPSVNHSIVLQIRTQPSFLSSLLHPLQEKLFSPLKLLPIISYWDDSTFFGFLPNLKNWKRRSSFLHWDLKCGPHAPKADAMTTRPRRPYLNYVRIFVIFDFEIALRHQLSRKERRRRQSVHQPPAQFYNLFDLIIINAWHYVKIWVIVYTFEYGSI